MFDTILFVPLAKVTTDSPDRQCIVSLATVYVNTCCSMNVAIPVMRTSVVAERHIRVVILISPGCIHINGIYTGTWIDSRD